MKVFDEISFNGLEYIIRRMYETLPDCLDSSTESKQTLLNFIEQFLMTLPKIIEDRDMKQLDFFFRQTDYLFLNYYASLRNKLKQREDLIGFARQAEFKRLTKDAHHIKSLFCRLRMFFLLCLENKAY